MNIKKIVKLSFILIAVFVLLIFFTNTIVLHQIKENDYSKTNIAALVSMQENMNDLVKDILSSQTHDELRGIQKEFWAYEKTFEHTKEKFFEKEKKDLFDYIIKDIHEHQAIHSHLKSLYKNEKEIEEAFEMIFSIQVQRIELKNLFEQHYPQESYLRNIIEAQILKTKDIQLLKQLSDMKYYSKEMLFQHKNEEYFTKWIDKIKTLQHHHSIEVFNQYLQTAQTLGTYILKLETLQQQEIQLQNEIENIIKTNKKINHAIQNRIDTLSDDFLNNSYWFVLIVLSLTMLFIFIFSYKVNKNVALSVDEIEAKVDDGIKEIKNLNKEIEQTQKEVIFTMGAIGESRSKETGNHVKRVAQYSKILALHYGLSSKEAHMLKLASPMHDIGKVAIADAILNKPGRFDAHERSIMETHATLGYDLLKHSQRPLLQMAAIISHEHHEKWDGSGYPNGKKGEDIHIYGRITALADVFDALGSDRCYKKAWSDEKIFALFKEERGKHFDPKLVDIFFEHLDEFLKIRETFKDT
jgi:response regulator RpfG family c-di-GMP phosphodiesterase